MKNTIAMMLGLVGLCTATTQAQNSNDHFFAEQAIPVKDVTGLGGFFGDRIRKNKRPLA